jgi:hypothetical protein
VTTVTRNKSANADSSDDKTLTAEEASEQALKVRDERVEEDEKVSDRRDKEQQDAAEAGAKAKGQPPFSERRDVAVQRQGVDYANQTWTVQSERPYYQSVADPGQAFVRAQLPHRAAQRAAGIDPDAHTAGLTILDDDEAVSNITAGPEPWEARDLGLI